MLRAIILLLLTLAAGVALAMMLGSEPGLVRVYYGGEVWETPLPIFAALTIGAMLAIWAAAALLGWAWQFPARLRAAQQRRKHTRARHALTQGLIEIAEGEWRKGERRLVRFARDSDTPLINYLAAARAAQLLLEDERRDAYLKAAYESTPAATTAVLLTQAELQMAHGQFEHALATLRRLQEIAPGHAYGLKLLARAYEFLGDWHALEQLLPRLRKTGGIREEELERLEILALEQAFAKAGNEDGLNNVWSNTPRRLRRLPGIVSTYARRLMHIGAQERAETVLRDALKREWRAELVLLYGDLKTATPEKLLGRVEQWVKERGDDAALLSAAGSLCATAGLWGKARSYLETSIRLEPRPRTYQRLGQLLQELGQPEAAMQAFRKGLESCPVEFN